MLTIGKDKVRVNGGPGDTMTVPLEPGEADNEVARGR
jgi:hypothetical protein